MINVDIKDVEVMNADDALAAMDAMMADDAEVIREDLTSIFTDAEPSAVPPVCGDLEHCECGLCAVAYAEYLASESSAICARCGGCGRIEINTIAGRMLDACPDCTQPNNFF